MVLLRDIATATIAVLSAVVMLYVYLDMTKWQDLVAHQHQPV